MRQPRCSINISKELNARVGAAAEALNVTNRVLIERAIEQFLATIFELPATPSEPPSVLTAAHDKTNFYALRDAGRRDALVAMAATDFRGQDLLLACAVDPVTDHFRPLAAIIEYGAAELLLGREP